MNDKKCGMIAIFAVEIQIPLLKTSMFVPFLTHTIYMQVV